MWNAILGLLGNLASNKPSSGSSEDSSSGSDDSKTSFLQSAFMRTASNYVIGQILKSNR